MHPVHLSRVFLVDQFLATKRHGAASALRLVVTKQPELQLCGLAQKRFETGRILQTRHLNQYSINALALNGRFSRSKSVYPPPDNFQRLLHRATDPGLHAAIRKRQADSLAIPDNIEFLHLHTLAEQAGVYRLREATQNRECLFNLRFVRNVDAGALGGALQVGITDFRIAQPETNIADQLFAQHVFQGRCIHLQQNMTATLQIEPEGNRLAWNKPGQCCARLLAQQIRQCQQSGQHNDADNYERLQFGKMQHGSLISPRYGGV